MVIFRRSMSLSTLIVCCLTRSWAWETDEGSLLPWSPTAATFSPPAQAETPIMGTSSGENFRECLNRSRTFALASSRRSSRCSDGNISILFRATTRWGAVSSARTKHSVVWACHPLYASTTSRTTSMICAPPMMVRIRDAWPGQSTSVICRYLGVVEAAAAAWFVASLVVVPALFCCSSCSLNRSGKSIKKHENPKSSVIPFFERHIHQPTNKSHQLTQN
mmetsp:Transcript_103813/g.211863  ORF Transcript_103813/g.211863 Transcript_103813/m.211863 type:complete len:220 (-) Transcript_103813:613-1272(-)